MRRKVNQPGLKYDRSFSLGLVTHVSLSEVSVKQARMNGLCKRATPVATALNERGEGREERLMENSVNNHLHSYVFDLSALRGAGG